MLLDRFELCIRNIPFNHIGGSRLNDRLFVFFDKLHALYRGIRTLVKLPRKELYGKYPASRRTLELLFIQSVNRRFCKYAVACFLKSLFGDIFHIIADQYPDILNILNPQITLQLMLQFLRLHRKSWLLLDVHSFYIAHKSSSIHEFYAFYGSIVSYVLLLIKLI